MKVYTKTGDKGATSLFSGKRVSKDDDRVDAYGTVDELSSHLGLLAAKLPGDAAFLVGEIRAIQADLLAAGAVLATEPGSEAAQRLSGAGPERVEALEAAMDRMDDVLSPIRGFILPGGHEASGHAHVARTVCRRAERLVVRVAQQAEVPEGKVGEVIRYLNRLSDYLFVAARYVNRTAGVEDVLWHE
ncbi:MAG: cob(I)yrinic acid a,c-diamide adenosyltransferase [Desulfatibacillaceae bacterium]